MIEVPSPVGQMKANTQESAKIATRADWLRQWVPIALILLLATALDLYQLGTESLWLDEVYSIRDAKGLQLISVRPFYFILLRVWMQFGTSEAWLRGLAVLFGLGSVFLTYQLGRRLAGESTGLIAALLLTLSPRFINHSQEVRMYTVATFLGLGGTLALTYALEHPTISSMRWWAGTRLLTILTSPPNITLLLPDMVLFGWRFRSQRRVLFAFGKWLLLIGILWLPFAFSLAKATPEFIGGWIAEYPHPSANDVVITLTNFMGWLFETPFNAIAWFYNKFFKVYAVMLVCLLGIALLNKQHPRLIWIAAWAFLPSATIFLISQVSSTFWIDRYLLFLCPYVFILLAAGFTRIWHWQRTVAIVVALVYTVAILGGLASYYTLQKPENWRGVAQTIAINQKPDDTIGIIAERYRLALLHYYHGFAPVYAIEDEAYPVNQSKIDKSFLKRVLHSFPPIKSRLWLVYPQRGDKKRHQMSRTIVREQFRVQKHWIFEGLDLFLVTPASTKQVGKIKPPFVKNSEPRTQESE